MKSTLLFFTIVTLLSCNDPAQKPVKLIPVTITDDSSIVGIWTMCAMASNGSMISFNVCPTVNFKTDGNGLYTSNTEEAFTWTLMDKKLYISPIRKDSSTLLKNGSYSIFFTSSKYESKQLEITSKEGTTFYLSKIQNIY